MIASSNYLSVDVNVVEKVLGKITALGLLGLALAACSQQQVYELVRENRLEACERNPAAAADDCKQSVTGPYQDYEETLKDLDASRRAGPI